MMIKWKYNIIILIIILIIGIINIDGYTLIYPLIPDGLLNFAQTLLQSQAKEFNKFDSTTIYNYNISNNDDYSSTNVIKLFDMDKIKNKIIIEIPYCFTSKFCDIVNLFTWAESNSISCDRVKLHVHQSLDKWGSYINNLKFIYQNECKYETYLNFSFDSTTKEDDSILGVALGRYVNQLFTFEYLSFSFSNNSINDNLTVTVTKKIQQQMFVMKYNEIILYDNSNQNRCLYWSNSFYRWLTSINWIIIFLIFVIFLTTMLLIDLIFYIKSIRKKKNNSNNDIIDNFENGVQIKISNIIVKKQSIVADGDKIKVRMLNKQTNYCKKFIYLSLLTIPQIFISIYCLFAIIIAGNCSPSTTIILHEIGHVMGLGHNTQQYGLMFPFIYPQSFPCIGQDERNGLKSIYKSAYSDIENEAGGGDKDICLYDDSASMSTLWILIFATISGIIITLIVLSLHRLFVRKLKNAIEFSIRF